METEGSLPCSREQVPSPYPKPDQSGPRPDIIFLKSISILSSHLRLGLASGSFLLTSVFHFLHSHL
jgi:hypothetical protein